MDFEYLLGLYNFRNGTVKMVAGFVDIQQAKEYGNILDGQLRLNTIPFIYNSDGTLFCTQALRVKEKWRKFEDTIVFDACDDREFRLSDKVWKSDFTEAFNNAILQHKEQISADCEDDNDEEMQI